MKIHVSFKSVLLISFVFLFSVRSVAQSFENAGQYLDYIGKANQTLTQTYMVYLSGVSHGKSARKVEKRRLEVIQAINDTRYSIMGIPPYKGDRTLKDSTVAYLKMLNIVFNEDYGKIVNMEEIAEQSYDLMEAYMLAQEKANEKLHKASESQNKMQRAFAEKNNITLIESNSEMDTKMEIASQVMKHYDEVYLIFFKAYKQEAYLMSAIEEKNINSIEQNMNSLKEASEEGIKKLQKLKGYNNDGSIIGACKNMLIFYKDESEKGSSVTDFYLKDENFAKMKKQFDAKNASKRTKQDIDQFNNSVNDLNNAVNNFNAMNNNLNKNRATNINQWNKTVSKYLDTHVPVQRK